MARLPATLILMAAGIAVEVALGLIFGIIAADQPRRLRRPAA